MKRAGQREDRGGQGKKRAEGIIILIVIYRIMNEFLIKNWLRAQDNITREHPFLSSSQRLINFNTSTSPGPGTYNPQIKDTCTASNIQKKHKNIMFRSSRNWEFRRGFCGCSVVTASMVSTLEIATLWLAQGHMISRIIIKCCNVHGPRLQGLRQPLTMKVAFPQALDIINQP